MKNRAIRELHRRWTFNGDLMTCVGCGYSVIATRMHEIAHHASDCENEGERNPWLQLADILRELNADPTKAGVTTVDAERFPQQGAYGGKRVRVCFNYDSTETLLGLVVRDDAEAPWRLIIRLDDGRYVLSTECQWQPIDG